MLIYKWYKIDGNLIFYHYYPEESGAIGVVSIDRFTGKTEVVKPSKDDFGNRYAFKLMNRLREFFANNAYKETGTIAWY